MHVDRDINTVRNILAAGQELANVEELPLLVQQRRISKFVPMKEAQRL
ncbi:MAG: hypothetical protein QXL00_05765 [Conexivisphaerales archaeon]